VVSDIPDYARKQPHVAIEPSNDGVFG